MSDWVADERREPKHVPWEVVPIIGAARVLAGRRRDKPHIRMPFRVREGAMLESVRWLRESIMGGEPTPETKKLWLQVLRSLETCLDAQEGTEP